MRIAAISVHGCPVIQAGAQDAGGMNIYVLETARRLTALGASIDVFARRHDPDDPQCIELAPGARLIHLDAGPVDAPKDQTYPLLPEFTEQLLAFRRKENVAYDLISSHYWLSGLVGLKLGRLWGIPHVTSFHTLAEVKRRARPGEREAPIRTVSEAKIASGATRIVVWTPHERDAITRYYQADPDKIDIIPPGVDTHRFRPVDQAAARARLGLDGEMVLLFVGRIERLKGVDILLETAAALDYKNKVTLVIAGGSSGSPEMARLKKIAGELGISTMTRFLGSVPQSELAHYYNAADVCVLPSYYESFGLAALEASACGTPVVASRVGGLPSVVKDGETGYLIPWRCPGPFVDKIELLLANHRLRRDMGVAARAHAETLTWEAAAARLLGVFEELRPAAPPVTCLAAAG